MVTRYEIISRVQARKFVALAFFFAEVWGRGKLNAPKKGVLKICLDWVPDVVVISDVEN